MGGYIPDSDFWPRDRDPFYHYGIYDIPCCHSLSYNRFIPYSSVSSEIDRLRNTQKRTTTVLNTYGWVSQTVVEYCAENDPNPYNRVACDSAVYVYQTVTLPNGKQVTKPYSVKTWNKRTGFSQQPWHFTKYNYAGGRLDKITRSDSDGAIGETFYTYNAFGQQVCEKVKPAGMDTISCSVVYDTKGRFPLTRTDALGHTSSATYDQTGGWIDTETDVNNLTTAYEHDFFGRVTSVTRPDGTLRNISYRQNGVTAFPEAVWYVREIETGTPETKTWYDILGRPVHYYCAGRGYDDIVYDTLGNTDKSTYVPYTDLAVPIVNKTWRNYAYDEYGRITSLSDPYSDLLYDYHDPLALGYYYVTVTDRIRDTESTRYFDPLGRMIRVVDAGGTVIYDYAYQTQSGKIRDKMTVTVDNFTTTILSDIRGNRLSIQDPDAGTVSSTYNALNQLKTRTDANGNQTAYTYDAGGRPDTVVYTKGVISETVAYTYDNAAGRGIGKPASVTHDGTVECVYEYDNLGRLYKRKEYDGVSLYSHKFEYNALGQLQYITYPSGFKISHTYNSFGELNTVSNATTSDLIYSQDARNKFRQPLMCRYGNGTGVQYTYNASGLLTGIRNGNVYHGHNANAITYIPGNEIADYSIGNQYRQLDYTYDDRGFIASRSDAKVSQSETYYYDELDRLESYKVNGTTVGSMGYDHAGNILSNPKVGTYFYSNAKPHAVTGITGNASCPIPSWQCKTNYNLRNLPSSISGDNYSITFDYGADGMRRHTRFLYNNSLQKTVTHISKLYEIETAGSVVRNLDYIYAEGRIVALHVRNGVADSLYYILTDHLGSWNKVMDQNKAIVQQTHFDPWGNRMDYTRWNRQQTTVSFPFRRGFTGHEHYDRFGIVNANARLYDPVIGRFFSPDPFVQAPDFTQNYNRYSYCLNNPVMYSDPDGENALLVVAAIYFLYFTEPGYEVQKYISPIAINNDIRFGSHQKGLGFNISFGIPKSLPYARRWEEGSSYYWKNYGDYRGYEHRKGSEQTVLSLYHWGDTHYESGEFTQTVGKKSFGIPSIIGVDVSNDLWGDGGDRFRTSHQRINCFPFYIGGSVFTGDPGMKKRRTNYEPNAASNQYYIKGPYGDPDKYRYGILYVGAGPFQRGWDSEGIRHILQNIIGHNWISPESPWFKYIEYEHRLYRQFGWGSLW